MITRNLLIFAMLLAVSYAADPTAEPTMWPTVNRDWMAEHHAFLPADWYPTVSEFHDPSGNFIMLFESYKSDGGMLNCSSFDQYSCELKIHMDTVFRTDATLSTKMTSGLTKFEDLSQHWTFLVDDKFVLLNSGGDVFHCSWYGEHKIIDEDGFETCYLLYDFNHNIADAFVDSFGKMTVLYAYNPNELKRCDVSGAETSVADACEDLGEINTLSSNAVTALSMALDEEGDSFYVASSDDVYVGEITVHNVDTLTVEFDWDNPVVSNDYIVNTLLPEPNDDGGRIAGGGYGKMKFFNNSLWFITDSWQEKLFKCTDVDTCEKVDWAQKYGGQYRYRDDDGGTVMTSSQGLRYDPTYDCVLINGYTSVELFCPNGLPANTMPVMAHGDDDDDIMTDELIVATAMAVLGGAISMFLMVYIITQLNQAKAAAGVAAVPSTELAGSSEIVSA